MQDGTQRLVAVVQLGDLRILDDQIGLVRQLEEGRPLRGLEEQEGVLLQGVHDHAEDGALAVGDHRIDGAFLALGRLAGDEQPAGGGEDGLHRGQRRERRAGGVSQPGRGARQEHEAKPVAQEHSSPPGFS